MKMIGRIVMNSKMNVNATGSNQKVVSKELCGGCHSFDGFSCDLQRHRADSRKDLVNDS